MIAPVISTSKPSNPQRRQDRIVTADPLTESCRTLLRRLAWKGNHSGNPLSMIGLTSCHSGEGVTTITHGLAQTAAASGEHSILLVDFNLNNSHKHGMDSRSSAPIGVADVLVQDIDWRDAVSETDLPGLSILPAGHAYDDSDDAIDAQCLPELITELKSNFDLVIADLPPAGEVSSALRIGRFLDGLLIVVESEQTRREVVSRLKSQLECTGSNLLGVILNRRQQHLPSWLYDLF